MWAVPESLPVRSQVCIDLLCRISTKSSTLPGSTKSVPLCVDLVGRRIIKKQLHPTSARGGLVYA
eukprot:COSAG05_NODE_15267_length_374_cov_0.367273_1_plen_64_part_10